MRTGPPSTLRTDDLGDVLQFMRVLWALVHALQRTSKRMERGMGVTGPQRLVIRAVGLFPGVTPGELAQLLHVHPSTLTGVLRKLVDQQWLERAPHGDDRRAAVLRLTPAGARVNARRKGTVEHAVRNVLGTLSARDQAAATRALARITAALDPAAPEVSSLRRDATPPLRAGRAAGAARSRSPRRS
jgi:DNA-binding MarR family transcriptional regulator